MFILALMSPTDIESDKLQTQFRHAKYFMLGETSIVGIKLYMDGNLEAEVCLAIKTIALTPMTLLDITKRFQKWKNDI